MLLEPAVRPPELLADLSNLIILTAQTGDEWQSTCDLVAQHAFPVFREYRCRTVEVARAGPRRADGIVVLQDSREPTRMHPDPEESGYYALSREGRDNGVMPVLSSRACSVNCTNPHRPPSAGGLDRKGSVHAGPTARVDGGPRGPHS